MPKGVDIEATVRTTKPEMPLEVMKWNESNEISSANLRNGCWPNANNSSTNHHYSSQLDANGVIIVSGTSTSATDETEMKKIKEADFEEVQL